MNQKLFCCGASCFSRPDVLIMVVCLSAVLCFPVPLGAFELGFYHGTDTTPSSYGADYIMPYTMVSPAFLDSCAGLGLKVLMELPRSEVDSIDPMNPNDTHLAAVESFILSWQANGQEHSAIKGWYLYDEPMVWGVTSDQLRVVYDRIRKHSDLPVYLTFSKAIAYGGAPSQNQAMAFADCFDVLMYDDYPCFSTPTFGIGSEEFAGFTHQWRRSLNIAASMANQMGKSFVPVLQSMGAQIDSESQYEKLRLPTLPEAHYQMHLSIQAGADELIWFMFSKAMDSKALSGAAYPYDGQTWIGPGSNAVFAPLREEVDLYGDAIDHGEIYGGIKNASDADLRVKVFYSPSQNKTYVLALNRAARQLDNVSIALNLDKTYSMARRVGASESGNVTVIANSLTDSFSPYQAHVYELDTTGEPVALIDAKELACAIEMDMIRPDGQCTLRVSNHEASVSSIKHIVLASATETRTFATFMDNSDFTVAPVYPTPNNVAISPGFESGSSGWFFDPSQFAVVSTQSYSGNNSLKCTRTNPADYKLASQNLGIQVMPGYTYSIGCWIKTDNVIANANGGGATLCLQWKDANNQWHSGVYTSGLSGTHDWTYVTLQGVCPEDAVYANVCLYLRDGATGTAWFDDVEIHQYAIDAQLTNSDFEAGLDGWSPNTGYTVQNIERHGGNSALQYVRTDPQVYKTLRQDIDTVVTGNRYAVGCWIKTENVVGVASGGATLCLQWLDANGSWVGGVYPKGLDGTNGWTFVSLEGICPDDAVSANITLYMRPGATGTAWFDDVTFVHYPNTQHNVSLTFNSTGLPAGSDSTLSTAQVLPEAAGGMLATVTFANGYRLQGIFRDRGDTDDDHPSHYIAQLTNVRKARVEIDPMADNIFDCRVANESLGLGIKRVRIDASNDAFDAFADGDKFTTVTNAGSIGDGLLSSYAILNFAEDNLAAGDATSDDQPGSNRLAADPQNLTATIYFADGSVIRGPLVDLGDPNVTLTNPGFESGGTDWWLSTSGYELQSFEKHTGSKALENVRTDPQQYTLARHDITSVVAGNRYSVSSWIKTENVIAGSGGGATLCLQWRDANGQWAGGVYPQGLTGTNDWTKVTGNDLLCPANAVSANIILYLRPNATGMAWFDDVSLTINAADARNFVLQE